MKAALEIWKDATIILIMDDTMRVIDRYETDGLIIKDHRHEGKYADLASLLPPGTQTIG